MKLYEPNLLLHKLQNEIQKGMKETHVNLILMELQQLLETFKQNKAK